MRRVRVLFIGESRPASGRHFHARDSGLYRAVRERKLASSVTAYDYTPTALGVFVVHAETPPEQVGDAEDSPPPASAAGSRSRTSDSS